MLNHIIKTLPRDFAREQWTTLYRIMRKHYRPSIVDNSALACRARLRAELDAHAVDGFVSLNEWSRDCDMCEGTSSDLVSTVSVYLVERRIDAIYYNAEGPCHVWIDTPDNAVAPSLRDRALEAFENGHAHCIHV